MYYHLVAALLFWITGFLLPSQYDIVIIPFILMGFIAFIFFVQECVFSTKRKLLEEAKAAESMSSSDISSFTGKFVGIQNDKSPFPDTFSCITFNNGEINVPLFCNNEEVVAKLVNANIGTTLYVYYHNYILVDATEIGEPDS